MSVGEAGGFGGVEKRLTVEVGKREEETRETRFGENRVGERRHLGFALSRAINLGTVWERGEADKDITQYGECHW
jgi:hypothetical protein